MKMLEERIAAAIAAIDGPYGSRMVTRGHILPDDVRAIILAAFPELFDGTYWIAPREATELMRHAADIRRRYDWGAIWAAMRDAYMQEKEPSK